MKKLILSLLLLTVVLGCQNENNGSENSGTSNARSSEDIKAEMLKEKNRIKDSLKLLEEEEKEIESYTGDYYLPPPTGPGTGVCSESLTVKNKRLIGIEICGGHNENGHTESHDKLFNVDFKANKVYKVSSLFDTRQGHAFGCDYFEFKNNKLYMYDENMKIVNEDFCCGFVKKCDCIISKSK
ncbi:MAG: hypothetical protein K9G36_01695 [Crocinitomicaceae bacterium]|nr:hypothetical protein [Crocinitomicaceae bacterium]